MPRTRPSHASRDSGFENVEGEKKERARISCLPVAARKASRLEARDLRRAMSELSRLADCSSASDARPACIPSRTRAVRRRGRLAEDAPT